MPREIITLQLGSLSNYCGAHFWNIQDEALGLAAQGAHDGIAEDVLFAWSEDRHGAPIYYPRAVILDVSGAAGGVSFSSDAQPGAAAAAAAAGAVAWGGGVDVHLTGPVRKSAFTRQLEVQATLPETEPEDSLARHQAALEEAARQLDMSDDSYITDSVLRHQAPGGGNSGGGGGGRAAGANSGVMYWTDYLKAKLHPRSFLALPSAWHGGPGFDGYGAAEGLLHGARGAVEAAADQTRRWSEQCDSLQGVQVLCDDLSGFGGLSRSLLDELREELPGVKTLYFSLRSAEFEGRGGGAGSEGISDVRRSLSDALACAELSERAAVYVPLCVPPPGDASRRLPLLRRWPGDRGPYYAGALLAAAVDTVTLPFRLSGASSAQGAPVGATDLHSWANLLAARAGANFAAASMQLPAGPVETDEWRAAQQRDDRILDGQQSRGESPSGQGQQQQQQLQQQPGDYRLSTLYHAAALLPAPPLRLAPLSSLAESLVLRGPRLPAGGACAAAPAAEALDHLLRSEPQRRCVVHRCVAPAPLPVPLPFPGLFRDEVGPEGDVAWERFSSGSAGGTGAAARDGRHVSSCSVLTRVVATSEFGGWLSERAGALGPSLRGAAGPSIAEGWGYGRGELEEAGERLRQLAGSYSEALSEDELDD